MNERWAETLKTLLDALREWLFGKPVPVKVVIPPPAQRPMPRRRR